MYREEVQALVCSHVQGGAEHAAGKRRPRPLRRACGTFVGCTGCAKCSGGLVRGYRIVNRPEVWVWWARWVGTFQDQQQLVGHVALRNHRRQGQCAGGDGVVGGVERQQPRQQGAEVPLRVPGGP